MPDVDNAYLYTYNRQLQWATTATTINAMTQHFFRRHRVIFCFFFHTTLNIPIHLYRKNRSIEWERVRERKRKGSAGYIYNVQYRYLHNKYIYTRRYTKTTLWNIPINRECRLHSPSIIIIGTSYLYTYNNNNNIMSVRVDASRIIICTSVYIYYIHINNT